MAKYRLTKETFGRLQTELEGLETSLPAAIKAKREASQLGDLNENFEYDAAVAELDRIYARITQINDILREAKVITEVSTDVIDLGSYLTVNLIQNGGITTRNFRLVEKIYNLEAIEGEYKYTSLQSPFGQAVFGKKIGEAFEYMTPDRVRVTGEVVSIVSELENVKTSDKVLTR